MDLRMPDHDTLHLVAGGLRNGFAATQVGMRETK